MLVSEIVRGAAVQAAPVFLDLAATLDIVSDGRLTLGLGAGWFEQESEAYGIELGTLTERFDRFDEGMDVITSLLVHCAIESNAQGGKAVEYNHFSKRSGSKCG